MKEKYPNLNVLTPVSNKVFNFAESKLKASSKNNTFDLMFTINAATYGTKDSSGNDLLYDLTEKLYNSKVPGEDILYKDKVYDSYNICNKYLDSSSSAQADKYYFTSWASGMDSIIYNDTLLKALGIAVPNTTDELLAAFKTIKTKSQESDSPYKKSYSIIQSKDEQYMVYMFPVWWAQYEGISRYLDFWNGIDDNRISKNIFDQTGRLRSMEVFQQILDYDKGYYNSSSSTYEYITAQTMFLEGNGVFHFNGDWFDNEMYEIYQEVVAATPGYNYELK